MDKPFRPGPIVDQYTRTTATFSGQQDLLRIDMVRIIHRVITIASIQVAVIIIDVPVESHPIDVTLLVVTHYSVSPLRQEILEISYLHYQGNHSIHIGPFD